VRPGDRSALDQRGAYALALAYAHGELTADGPLHKPCPNCGATLHAPGFTFDGPTGPDPSAGQTAVPLRTTVPHTADRVRLARRMEPHAGPPPRSGRRRNPGPGSGI
jgi:hypothetical protein